MQRDAPDANYGRTFARFEARFQLTWVIGAFIPVVLHFRARYGYVLVTVAAAAAAVSYVVGVRSAGRVPEAPQADDLLFDDADHAWAATGDPVPGRPPSGLRRDSIDPTRAFPTIDPTTVAPTSPMTKPTADTWGSVPTTPVVSAGDGVHVERTRRAGINERDA